MTDIVYRKYVGESDLPQMMALVQSELVENLKYSGYYFGPSATRCASRLGLVYVA